MAEKKKLALSGERLVIVVLLVALTFTLAGFAIASAAPTAMPAANGIVRFCRANSNGNARIVPPSEACGTTERKVQMRSYDPIALRYDGEGGHIVRNIGGHVIGVTRTGAGEYLVAFDKDISKCVPTVSITDFTTHYGVTSSGNETNEIYVFTFAFPATADDTALNLAVTC